MALFSERNKITPKKAFQIEKLDEETRNRIFNVIHKCYSSYTSKEGFEKSFKIIYTNHFKRLATDSLVSSYASNKFQFINEHIQKSKWNKVFDLIEYILKIEKDDSDVKKCLKYTLNQIFLKEQVAYKIVNWEITQITDDVEVESIEKAINNSPKVIKKHLEKSLKFLSNKTNPDYENSVKESISAVESTCRLILNDKNITLGKALKKIEKENNIKLNGSLKESFNILYGFTSSEDGVRHGSFDDKDLDYDLAKLLLVSCSAFTNYLLAKSDL
jgi:hypothetical protein